MLNLKRAPSLLLRAPVLNSTRVASLTLASRRQLPFNRWINMEAAGEAPKDKVKSAKDGMVKAQLPTQFEDF